MSIVCIRRDGLGAAKTGLVPPFFVRTDNVRSDSASDRACCFYEMSPPDLRRPEVRRWRDEEGEGTYVEGFYVLVHGVQRCVLTNRHNLRSGASLRLSHSSVRIPYEERREGRTMRESSSTSTSAWTAIFAKLTRKMALRLSRSGGETYRILSSLPGLINAGSYPQNQRPSSQEGRGTNDDIGSVRSC